MDRITTPTFRVSFPAVFEPKAMDEKAEKKYSIVMLFPKEFKDPTEKAKFDALVKAAQAAVAEKWGKEPEKRPKGIRSPFRDGDKEKSHMEGYAGHIFVSASSKMRPGVIDQKKNIVTAEDELLYPGCYARATLTVYAYDKAGNKGVAFGLQNIQIMGKGESFTGRVKAEDDFEEVQTDDTDAPKSAGATEGNIDELFA